MSDIECVFQSMNNKGSIYISNIRAAQNLQILKKLKISAICSVATNSYLAHSRQDIPYYMYIPAEDHQNFNIKQYFSSSFQFIDNARKQTNVLVHCMAGISRSATIVIAYLLKKYKYSLNSVISSVKRKRRKINPNPGFLEQLKQFSQQQHIKYDNIDALVVKQSRCRNYSAIYRNNVQTGQILKSEQNQKIINYSQIKNIEKKQKNRSLIKEFRTQDKYQVKKVNKIKQDQIYENQQQKMSLARTKLIDQKIKKIKQKLFKKNNEKQQTQVKQETQNNFKYTFSVNLSTINSSNSSVNIPKIIQLNQLQTQIQKTDNQKIKEKKYFLNKIQNRNKSNLSKLAQQFL